MEVKSEESKEHLSKDGTESSNDESGSSDEKDTLTRDAFRVLECGETELYFMITDRSLSTRRGIKMKLENVPTEQEKHISRIEGEMDARYLVDRSFVEALLTNDEMRIGLESLHTEKTSSHSEASNTLVQFLNCAFENRYDYLYSVYFWIAYRWEYLALNSEHQSLIEYFDEECKRCLGSIPQNKAAFAKWIELIKQVKTKMEEFKKEKGFGDTEATQEEAGIPSTPKTRPTRLQRAGTHGSEISAATTLPAESQSPLIASPRREKKEYSVHQNQK